MASRGYKGPFGQRVDSCPQNSRRQPALSSQSHKTFHVDRKDTQMRVEGGSWGGDLSRKKWPQNPNDAFFKGLACNHERNAKESEKVPLGNRTDPYSLTWCFLEHGSYNRSASSLEQTRVAPELGHLSCQVLLGGGGGLAAFGGRTFLLSSIVQGS